MSQKLFFVLFVSIVLLSSCGGNKDGFHKTSSGLEYKFIKENSENANPRVNEVVVLNIEISTEDGHLLFASADTERKYLKKIDDPSHPGGSFEDAILLMHLNDSAIFKIDAYNYYTFTESLERLPDKVKKGDKIIFKIGLSKILQVANYDDVILEQYHKNEETELKLLQEYLERTGIEVAPQESGLYYIELEKGSGKQAARGKTVSVHYTGTFIDGRLFDTSLDRRPFQFTIGLGQVIEGWEEGIALMKEGEKARLIIPSKLAYGSISRGEILPYSTLIFDVELISVK
ncbi:MAG: FKBP-type peptidyl-prolyl cis-trans isomerase [Bacteroidales bacterium]|nr:FKBP-type peptidyl-prolyl cis-trans isomerase [Bacteroidales bacterium]